jgi:hypothetical protein
MTRGPSKGDQKPYDAADDEPDQSQLQAKSEPPQEFVAMAPDDVPVEAEHAHIPGAPPLIRGGAPSIRAAGASHPGCAQSVLSVLDWKSGWRRLELDAEVFGERGLVVREPKTG